MVIGPSGLEHLLLLLTMGMWVFVGVDVLLLREERTEMVG